jgi:hypothetical protein
MQPHALREICNKLDRQIAPQPMRAGYAARLRTIDFLTAFAPAFAIGRHSCRALRRLQLACIEPAGVMLTKFDPKTVEYAYGYG